MWWVWLIAIGCFIVAVIFLYAIVSANGKDEHEMEDFVADMARYRAKKELKRNKKLYKKKRRLHEHDESSGKADTDR